MKKIWEYFFKILLKSRGFEDVWRRHCTNFDGTFRSIKKKKSVKNGQKLFWNNLEKF